MGSFSVSDEAIAKQLRWGKIVARAIEIDREAFRPKSVLPDRRTTAIKQAAKEIDSEAQTDR